MTELSLPYLSVSSSGDEYFQISFSASESDDDEDGEYFLIQRQFETPDGGRVYVESHQRSLCGHFRIRRAELRQRVLRLEFIARPQAKTVVIRFKADDRRYRELKNVLRTIFPPGVLSTD